MMYAHRERRRGEGRGPALFATGVNLSKSSSQPWTSPHCIRARSRSCPLARSPALAIHRPWPPLHVISAPRGARARALVLSWVAEASLSAGEVLCVRTACGGS